MSKPEPNVTVPAGDAAKGAKVPLVFLGVCYCVSLLTRDSIDLQGQVLSVPSD
jgi:hypothetical protein